MPDAISVPVTRMRAALTVLRIAWTADRRRSVLVIVLGITQAVTESMFAYWLKLILDGIQLGDARLVSIGAVGVAVSIAGGSALRYATARVRAVLVERAHHGVQRRLLELVGATPTLEIHETPAHLTQLEVLQGREAWQFGQVIPSLFNLMTLLVRIVATALLLVGVHPLLLVLPVFGLPALLVSSKTGSAISSGHDLAAEPTRRFQHLYELATTRGPAKEVRLFRLGEQLLARYALAHGEMQRIRRQVNLHAATLGASTRMVFVAGYFGAIVFVVDRAVDGAASVGDAALTAVLAGQVLGLVTGSSEILTWAWRTLTAAGRLVHLQEVSRAVRRRVDSSVAPPVRLVDGIRLEGVSYRYPHATGKALHDVNLTLSAGTTVAIVGDNGAGKTTLVRLLAGLYVPTSGRITLDGTDLTTVDPERWRERTSAGFQDHARFEFRVQETVGIGDLPRRNDSQAVSRALEQAGAADVLDSMPHGLSTQLGPSWEGGIDLSGGQWQKLALGRAMMRTTPLLLLLDEPTAALDADTEHRLFERWTAVAHKLRTDTGAITILVSHRFSTVRMADLIVVLDAGRIGEIGSHHELIARNGLYAELFELQARSYR
ncbi:ABC transporter ATP-binding protein [Flindersiella endophytica]